MARQKIKSIEGYIFGIESCGDRGEWYIFNKLRIYQI